MYSEQAIRQCAYVLTRCPYVAASRLPFVFCDKGPRCLQPCVASGLNKARCECPYAFN